MATVGTTDEFGTAQPSKQHKSITTEGESMPQRTTAPAGAPCWIDLMTSDTDSSRAFYGDLFGWASEQSGEEYGGYINFLRGGAPIAGCMSNAHDPAATNAWSVYLAVDDAKATVDAAVEHGGQVVVHPMDVGDLGTMAYLVDAGQAAVGIWQAGVHKGFSELGEPGTPSWFELHTRDYDASVAFYRDVFGWDTHVMSDAPEFRYTTLGEGEGALAGVMDASAFLPDGVPAHWSIYFGVGDTDAAVAKVVELGGTLVLPAEDTPYGRLASCADPNGAHFKLVTPPTA
jgi:predicted enzyme related to lactoylglutathione lyase